MPRYSTCLRVFLVAIAVAAGGCRRAQDTEAPVATPSVTVARADAAAGTPLEMNYRFVVAANAPAFTGDYWVFVHFLDTDAEMLWTDDHQPVIPTSQWKPGQTIEYPRTMFVPKFPYMGDTRIEVGLYSPKTGVRLPMTGTTNGQRSYQVASFNLRQQTDNLYVVFKDGWHETEVADEGIGVEWQWSKKNATLAFRNPRRDVTFYFQCDQPVQGLGEQQHVELRIGPTVIDSFALAPAPTERVLRKVPVSKSQFGDAETVEVTVAVDKTFVPATMTQLKSSDSRELGIRVFRAYVEAR
jgi:hypothetical protein